MDIKRESEEVKDELLVSTDDEGMSSYHCEHDSRVEESLVDRSCDYPSIYVKSEIDVKEEPLDAEEKDPTDDQLFEFVSVPVKEENQCPFIKDEIRQHVSVLDLDEDVDDFELEVMYDSDLDVNYVPTISSSDDSEEYAPNIRKASECHRRAKKVRRTSTPTQNPILSPMPSTSSAVENQPIPSASAIPQTLAANASSVPPASSVRPRRHRNLIIDEENVPSIMQFHTRTVSSTSGYRWSCHPQKNLESRIGQRNIITSFTPGPTLQARSATTPEKCFQLLFDDTIISETVNWTNQKIRLLLQNYPTDKKEFFETEFGEIKALLGLLIFSGCQKDNHLSTREMWNPITGSPLYRAGMSEERFAFLINTLRFDDSNTRVERKENDKFAAIRNIWDMFITNCGKMYIPNENITVDEQLLPFRGGKCPFKMYILDKPAKYGIKIVLANDTKSKYLLGAIPYLGKLGTSIPDNVSLDHFFTKELTKPYHHTNRNVTTDYWFTSVPLASDLNNCGMTIVGKMKANKTEVPIAMKDKEERRLASSAFLFTNEMTLVSYVPITPKTKKIVLVLSSMHTNPVLSASGKPEIIEYYNHTKGAVETFDQMCVSSSCGRKTKRWPLCIFYGMINACVINSYIIHNENMIRTGGTKLTRRGFMSELALLLIRPWAEYRLRNFVGFSTSLKSIISLVCDIPSTASQGEVTTMAAQRHNMERCKHCPRKSDRKSRYRCHKCSKAVCLSHIYATCKDCI